MLAKKLIFLIIVYLNDSIISNKDLQQPNVNKI